MTRHLTIYRDKKRQFRWTVTSTNGRKLADSGESYKRRIDCERIARSLFPWWQAAPSEPTRGIR